MQNPTAKKAWSVKPNSSISSRAKLLSCWLQTSSEPWICLLCHGLSAVASPLWHQLACCCLSGQADCKALRLKVKRRPLSSYYAARPISMNDLIFILFWREVACVLCEIKGNSHWCTGVAGMPCKAASSRSDGYTVRKWHSVLPVCPFRLSISPKCSLHQSVWQIIIHMSNSEIFDLTFEDEHCFNGCICVQLRWFLSILL